MTRAHLPDGTVVDRARSRPRHRPPRNYAFDVTPARLVTGFITERGVTPRRARGSCRSIPSTARARRRSHQT